MTKSSIPRNRLASETSPYLLQHAANPVDWHPWGDEALALAKALDKPILLSVGYSACHWCHVMAHESFEDPATADVMNDLFINIKVDREERPDIDKIYQLTHQLLTRRGGGWPLTVFLDPHQHLPIFAGTYFPRQPRFNLPGFVQLLRKVAAYYRDRPRDLAHNQSALREILDDLSNGHGQADVMDETLLTRAEQTLAAGFDPINGGFGHAPKFPHTSDLQFLHQRSEPCRAAADRKRQMIVTTLTEMASGGIYDQLGGGFFRYSVDDRWDIPHFEKMLYDNGPLLALYAELWRATGDPLFKRVVKETGDWTMGTMQSAEGGYFASLDADSEGGEGRHYTWDPEEIRSVLKPGDAAILESRFGLDRPPNFEGRWHLRVVRSPADICAHLNVVPQAVVEALARARRLMVQRRAQRIWPGRDEKILVAWNGLMIKGMAVAGRLLGRTDFIASAFRAFDFIRADCWKDGRLRAVWKDGRAPLNAYLDDYVMLIDAALELLQAQWRPEVLDWAITLAECTLRHFEDGERGGFYFTADDHEQLIHRPKPLMDESMPSGNAVAVAALARLGHLLGESRYIDASERALRSALPSVARYPDGHGALLCALNEWFHVPRIIILRGDPAAMSAWTSGLAAHPNCLSFAIPTGIVDLPGDLADRKPLGDVVAYVCSGRGCLPPIRTFDDLGSALLDRG